MTSIYGIWMPSVETVMVFSMYGILIMIYAGILMIYATIGEGYTVCMLLCRSSLRVVVFLRSPPARVTTGSIRTDDLRSTGPGATAAFTATFAAHAALDQICFTWALKDTEAGKAGARRQRAVGGGRRRRRRCSEQQQCRRCPMESAKRM